jgi:hypothetical protein
MWGLGICIVVVCTLVVFLIAWVGIGFVLTRRKWLVVASSVPAFLVFLVCSFLYLHPHFVASRPPDADVAGYYKLTSQTVINGGLAAFGDRWCDIELRPDGTFTATNLPQDEIGSPSVNFLNKLVTASGKWRLDVVSYGGSTPLGGSLPQHWGIILDSSPVNIHPIHLVGWKPPYRLYLLVDDPDCDYTMIFERAKHK